MVKETTIFRTMCFLVSAAISILLGSVGCDVTSELHDKPMENVYSGIDFNPLKSEQGVQKAVDIAAACQECVVFVHVSWAPMLSQGKRFEKFQLDFKNQYPDSSMQFHYIDFTPVTEGYVPLRSLPGWKELEANNNGSSLIHGYGEFVWLRKGRVLYVERRPDFISVADLMAKTKTLGMGSGVE